MDAGRAMPGQGWPVSAVPWRAREAQGIGSRFCFMRVDAMPGPPFFGYFLQRLKKVTRAIARNSAMRLIGEGWAEIKSSLALSFPHKFQTSLQTAQKPCLTNELLENGRFTAGQG